MRRIFALLLVLLPVTATAAAALEVRVHPADVVYAYEADPGRGIYTVMLQNVAVVQKEGGPVTVESLEIQAVNGGQIAQTLVIPGAGEVKGGDSRANRGCQEGRGPDESIMVPSTGQGRDLTTPALSWRTP